MHYNLVCVSSRSLVVAVLDFGKVLFKEVEELIGTTISLLGTGRSCRCRCDGRFGSVVGREFRRKVGRDRRCLGTGRKSKLLHNTNVCILRLLQI